ncbi:uncharacterized protein [Palaemon carinicauda]|uniref:uncharacterized protein isoform X2 n=1 Tax=Palaemon carinicauda TaxID=392227 RepID=UPI0035B5A11F
MPGKHFLFRLHILPFSLSLFGYIFLFSLFLSAGTVRPLSAHSLDVTSSTGRPWLPQDTTVILSPKTTPSQVASFMSREIDGKLPPITNGSSTLLTSPTIKDVGIELQPASNVTSSKPSGGRDKLKAVQVSSVTTPMKEEEEEEGDQESADLKAGRLMETSGEKLTPTMKSRREDEILEAGDDVNVGDDAVDDDDDNGQDEVVNCSYKEEAKTNVGTDGEDNGVANLKYERKNPSSLVPEVDLDPEKTVSRHSRVRRQAIALHGPLWTDKDTLFVELVAIADHGFCQRYRGGEAVDRIAKIVGVANMIMASLGVVVVLVDVELWSSGNKANVYPVKEQTLESINKYRESMLKRYPGNPNDNAMLITTELANGAGVASIGGMCSESNSVSIVQDLPGDIRVLGLFLAHEMGHNFKMRHDGDDKGEYFSGIGRCEDNRNFIMQPSLGHEDFMRVHWSPCSLKYFENMKKTVDLDCLKNIPKESYRAVCGNGIVEDGEDCDCGLPEFCKTSCCDPNTCRFAPRARCASGACCNTATCQPHEAGTVCRAASDSCDLPEYCSGDSERCPDDVHKGDGSYCGYYNNGHCYKGKCGAHDERCGRLWGYGVTVADSTCFKKLNKLSDRHGNCGQDPTTKQYVHCDDESLMCGTLYCNNNGHGKVDISVRKRHFVNQQWVESSMCQYVEGYLDHYPMRDWLSPNGANCGDRKMCVNQRCTRIPGSDDSLDCNRKCSGRGVCNSKGHCHCNPGYAPPDCSQPGSGGSYESGPAGEGSSGGIIAAFVLLSLVLLLVILLIIMCCTWDRLRRWWEDAGRSKVSPLAPKAVSCIDNCFCVAVSKVIQWMVSQGPLGKITKPNLSSPGIRKQRSKSPGYRVDVEIKRTSQPNFTDVEGQHTWKTGQIRNSQQKPLFPPVLPNKNLEDNVTRPKYEQSISVDSGCVIDDHEEYSESHSTNVSMSSLVSVFRNYTSKTSNEPIPAENRRSLMQDHQKEVSLRRLVTDPRSKHCLPQPYQKPPNSRHSVSTDIPMKNAKNPILKSSEVTRNDRSVPNVNIQERNVRKPLVPPYRSRTPPAIGSSRVTPPRATPPREIPPRPPVLEHEVKIVSGKGKTVNKFRDQGSGNSLQNEGPVKKDKRTVNALPQRDSKPNGPQASGDRSVRNLAKKFENS